MPIYQDLQGMLNELRITSIHNEHLMNVAEFEAKYQENPNNWMKNCSLEKDVEVLYDEN